MAVSRKSLKVLWARSAGRCAVCRCHLAEAQPEDGDLKPLGETAHIVSASASGPRGSGFLTEDEKDSYHNLILLCPTHHREVDGDAARYPSEKLFVLKSKHEHWVERQLEGRDGIALLPPMVYDVQDIQNLLHSWLQVARRHPGIRTVRFREVEADVGLDAGVARQHLPELLKSERVKIISEGVETIRFVIPEPELLWASAGRRPSADLLEEF